MNAETVPRVSGMWQRSSAAFATVVVSGSAASSRFPLVGLVSLIIGVIGIAAVRWPRRPSWAANATLVTMFAVVIFAAITNAPPLICTLSSCALVVGWDIDGLSRQLSEAPALTQLRSLQRTHVRVLGVVVVVSLMLSVLATNTGLHVTWPRAAALSALVVWLLFRVDKMIRRPKNS